MRSVWMCAIFRDERRYLVEWLAFHLAQGVEHFVLYDNFSADEPKDVLTPFVDAGLVTVFDWPYPLAEGGQTGAYQDCLDRCRDARVWVAFLDIDEFLYSPSGSSLPDILERFRGTPGIAVRWQVYGSSGQRHASNRMVIERFTRRAPTRWIRNRRTKCVVDPARVTAPRGPHLFTTDRDPLVDERHRPLRVRTISPQRRRLRRATVKASPRAPIDPYAVNEVVSPDVSVDLLRINHYAVKSLDEYRDKRRRFLPPAPDTEGHHRRYSDTYFRYHDRNDVHDPVLVPTAGDVSRILEEIGASRGQ